MNKHILNIKQTLVGNRKNILLALGAVLLLVASACGGYIFGYQQADKQNLSSVQSNPSDDKKSADDSDLADESKDIESDLNEDTEDGVSEQEDTSEEQPRETNNLESTYEVKTVGESLTFEIKPKGAAPAYFVDYRLSGEVVALGSNVNFYLIDSSGKYAHVAGLIINNNNPREGQIRIPFQVYNCGLGDENCDYKDFVDISKGMGTLVVTHYEGNQNRITDISVPIEIL